MKQMRSISFFISITSILFPGSWGIEQKNKKLVLSKTWEQLGFTINGDSVYDHFGEAVALSDDGLTLAIGAPYNGDGGYIQVFRNSQTQWQQMGHAIIGETLNEQMGSSIALSGDGYIIACGARGYDTDTAYAVGRVRVFALTYGGNWLQMGSDLIGHAEYDLFGYATTLSGNGLTLAVGSPYFDSASTDEGLVQVFSYVGSDWVQKGSDLVGDWGGDNFGASLSLSWDGLTLAVGSPKYDVIGDRNEGLVRVYVYGGSDWSQKGGDLLGSMNEQEFGTGLSLSNSGSIVACGSDKVHVYTYDNRISDWRQIGKPMGGTGGKAVKKAFSLSGDGMTVAIGGWNYVDSVVDEGKVSVYGFNGNEWAKQDGSVVIMGQSGYFVYCGSVIISNDGNVVVSACTSQESYAGAIRVYEHIEEPFVAAPFFSPISVQESIPSSNAPISSSVVSTNSPTVAPVSQPLSPPTPAPTIVANADIIDTEQEQGPTNTPTDYLGASTSGPLDVLCERCGSSSSSNSSGTKRPVFSALFHIVLKSKLMDVI